MAKHSAIPASIRQCTLRFGSCCLILTAAGLNNSPVAHGASLAPQGFQQPPEEACKATGRAFTLDLKQKFHPGTPVDARLASSSFLRQQLSDTGQISFENWSQMTTTADLLRLQILKFDCLATWVRLGHKDAVKERLSIVEAKLTQTKRACQKEFSALKEADSTLGPDTLGELLARNDDCTQALEYTILKTSILQLQAGTLEQIEHDLGNLKAELQNRRKTESADRGPVRLPATASNR